MYCTSLEEDARPMMNSDKWLAVSNSIKAFDLKWCSKEGVKNKSHFKLLKSKQNCLDN